MCAVPTPAGPEHATEYVVVVVGFTVTVPASSEYVPVAKFVPEHPVELLMLLGTLVATFAEFVEDQVRLTGWPAFMETEDATRVELTVTGETAPLLTQDT